MKKINILLIIALSALAASCVFEPEADFSANKDIAYVDERINFYNHSSYADYYEWDFGDGTYSSNFNASHSYESPGYYTVTLRAYENDIVSVARMTIEVISNIDFSVNTQYTDIGYNVVFTNYSSGVDYYEWDFGDGTYSNAINPVHSYTRYGTYLVSLTGIKGNRVVDYSEIEIYVNPTRIIVTVRDYDTDELIPFIPVTLFNTYNNWYNFTNEVAYGETDRYGDVIFDYMTPMNYYVDASDDYYTNYFLVEDFVDGIDFIEITDVWPGYDNLFTAWVEYAPIVSGTLKSSSARPQREAVKIRKIEKTFTDKKELLKATKPEAIKKDALNIKQH